MTEQQEPVYIPVCELCGSSEQVQLTADPDKGGLLLCEDCRDLFGFGGEDGSNI